MSGLTSDQIAAYRTDGFSFPFTAMPPQEMAGYLARMEAFEAEYGERARGILRQKSHLVLTFVDELIHNDSVLDKVESIIGPDILCWSTSFFIKQPNDGKFISWHQDAEYWGLEADDVVSVWIALTPSHAGNGCMRVVPQSHLTVLPHNETRRPDNMLTRGQEVAVQVNEEDAVNIELLPGQFSLHHQRIIHGSRANFGNERRVGLAIRYLRPTARQVVESTDSATLVRGVDTQGHFAHERRPNSDMEPAAVEFLKMLDERRANGVYRLR